MTTEEAYQILGLDGQADAQGVKLAYRRRAMQWHPDRCLDPGRVEHYAAKFREAKAAYEQLRREGYPELPAEPIPEPDFGPRVAGRSFSGPAAGPPGEAEAVSQAEKLGLKLNWSLEAMLLWGALLIVGGGGVVWMLKFLVSRLSQ